jgi:hypothetical protein
VGDPDQVLAKLRAYQALGMEAFILSGYPHVAEGDLFARHVLRGWTTPRCFPAEFPAGTARGRLGRPSTPRGTSPATVMRCILNSAPMWPAMRRISMAGAPVDMGLPSAEWHGEPGCAAVRLCGWPSARANTRTTYYQ